MLAGKGTNWLRRLAARALAELEFLRDDIGTIAAKSHSTSSQASVLVLSGQCGTRPAHVSSTRGDLGLRESEAGPS